MHADHVEDLDWATMLDALRRADAVEAELNSRIARWLLSGQEQLVADLGCGAGGMTVALAAAVGRDTRVIAVDGQPALLAETRRRTAEVTGVAVETVVADLAAGPPREVANADLIWASSVVHHLPDQTAAIRELARALAPAGLLALGEGGLRPVSLPWDLGVGEPGLELRLDAVQDSWFAAMRRDLPGSVRMDGGWSAALQAAGLVDVTARSFLLDLPAPLPAPAIEMVVERLRGFVDRDELAQALDASDRDVLRRLTDSEDEVHQRLRDELFLLAVRTVHIGRDPRSTR